MIRECEYCGASYETVRPSARFCSGACRTRAFRDPGGVRVPVSGVAGGPVMSALQGAYGAAGGRPGAPAVPARRDGPTCDAVRSALVAAGRKEGFLAAIAVDLAGMVDNSTGTLGFAALVSELRLTMDAALAGAKAPVDPVDDLRRRRDRKYRGR